MSFFLGGKESAAPVLVKHMAKDLRWCSGGMVVCGRRDWSELGPGELSTEDDEDEISRTKPEDASLEGVTIVP